MNALASALTNQYRLFGSRTTSLVRSLSDDEVWTKPYPYGNSVGHLLLHIIGNLNYYIGARIAGTGYVRNRDLEFMDTSRRPSASLLIDLDQTIAMVTDTIAKQSDEDWEAAYDAVNIDERTRAGIMVRCAGHFHHHLGQIIYLVKEHQRRRA